MISARNEVCYMKNEKNTIEYALHAYDTFWEYYKRTLDERNHILNNYLAFVGIPTSIIGVFIENIKNNLNTYRFIIVLVLSIIYILGLVIYSTYVIENIVSQRYLKKINHITQYLIIHFDKKYNNVFLETYELGDLFLDYKNSQRQHINKSFIIIVVNTMIMIVLFLLIVDDLTWYRLLLSISISVIIHVVIYFYHNRQIIHN